MRRPRLTNRILDGIATALAHANAGGPADLGLCANTDEAAEAPEVQRRMQEVADAFAWVQAMQRHRAAAKAERDAELPENDSIHGGRST